MEKYACADHGGAMEAEEAEEENYEKKKPKH
jgi:hypothetical protein